MGNDDLMQLTVPKINITADAKNKLDMYMSLVPGEISGVGTVERKGNDFCVTDVFIFPQESSSAATEIKGEDLAIGLAKLRAEIGLDFDKVKLWWHSHGTMAVMWSGTDDNNIEETWACKDSPAGDWFVSIVGNKRKEFRTRLDLYEPFRATVDNMALTVVKSLDTTKTETKDTKLRECDATLCAEIFEVPKYLGKDEKERKYCDSHNAILESLGVEVTEKVKEPAKTVSSVRTVYSHKGSEGWRDHYFNTFCMKTGCTNRVKPGNKFCGNHEDKDDEAIVTSWTCKADGCDDASVIASDYCDYHDQFVDYIEKELPWLKRQPEFSDATDGELVGILNEQFKEEYVPALADPFEDAVDEADYYSKITSMSEEDFQKHLDEIEVDEGKEKGHYAEYENWGD